jgi:SAM-dependent methyltransferase
MPSDQVVLNTNRWRDGDHVSMYANRELTPVEVLILVRYREALSGRVLEVGCGAGRVLGYLVMLAREVHGVDISGAMVDYCRQRYPDAHVHVGDVARVDHVVDGRFDAIVAAANLIDVFDDEERHRVLAVLRELLAPDGVLIFSTHNLARSHGLSAPGGEVPAGRRAARLLTKALDRPPIEVVAALGRIPRRVRNRRRLAPLQRHEADYSIINDEALDFGLLHYYIRRDAQERQLAELGFELVECLDVDGRQVLPGGEGLGSSLHYVARAG